MLNGIRVLLMTTGHEATDHRVYDKEALSLSSFGASVIVIGKQFKQQPDTNNVKIIVTPNPQNRFQRFLQQPWRCWSIASNMNIDILHIHDAELLQIVPWIRLRWPKTKIVYDVHEDFTYLISRRSYLPEVTKPFLSKVTNISEKRIAKLVHGIVGATQPLADRFVKNRRIGIYNFPSKRFYATSKRLAKPISQRKYDIIHLGTLSLERAKFLAETLQILHQQKSNTKTLITGVHDHIYKQLQTMIPPGCEIEGKISYSQVSLRLGNARIGIDIHPFHTRNLNVAVPVKVFEYMACGCAVVTSQMPVFNQLIAKSNVELKDIITIHGGTPEIYANAVRNMLERVNDGEDVGKRLQVSARCSFMWEREAEKLVNFYLELLKC